MPCFLPPLCAASGRALLCASRGFVCGPGGEDAPRVAAIESRVGRQRKPGLVLYCLSGYRRARAPSCSQVLASQPHSVALQKLGTHWAGVCRGTRVVDSLGRLGSGVRIERPWRRNLLSLPSWVAPRETAQVRCWSVHLHHPRPPFSPCSLPGLRGPQALQLWVLPSCHGGELASWKTSTLTQLQ